MLNKFLEFEHPGRVLPLLPPKNPLTKISLNSDEFLKDRVAGLRQYMDRLTESSTLLNSIQTFHFLFSQKKEYALYLKKQSSSIIEVEQSNIMSKVTDFMSYIFSKPK